LLMISFVAAMRFEFAAKVTILASNRWLLE